MTTYYDILGVASKANADEIKAASLRIEQGNHRVAIRVEGAHGRNAAVGEARIERTDDDFQKLSAACKCPRNRRVANYGPFRIVGQQVEDATRAIPPCVKTRLNKLLVAFLDINFLCHSRFLPSRNIIAKAARKASRARRAVWFHNG